MQIFTLLHKRIANDPILAWRTLAVSQKVNVEMRSILSSLPSESLFGPQLNFLKKTD
jgi:hypothetical protein